MDCEVNKVLTGHHRSLQEYLTHMKVFDLDDFEILSRVLCLIHTSVCSGQVSALSNLLHTLKYTVMNIGLRKTCHKFKDPFTDTNIIIETARHEQSEVLSFLLDNNAANLVLFSTCTKSDDPHPADRDAYGHTAIYYAVRSLNPVILLKLLSFWSALPPEEVDPLLGQSLWESCIRNVPQSFVVQRIIANRLLQPNDSTAVPPLIDNNRPDMVTHLLQMIDIFVNTSHVNESINDEGIYILRNIVAAIHDLRCQQGSNDSSIPWEEVEFCLAVFILSNTTELAINFAYRIYLTKSKTINYLKYLSDRVKGVLKNDHQATENSQESLKHALQEDFRRTRDLESLFYLDTYFALILQLDPSNPDDQWHLIKLAEIIADFTISISSAPRLSPRIASILLLTVSSMSKSLINDFKGHKSAKYRINRRLNIVETWDGNLFKILKKDLKSIANAVRRTLWRERIIGVKDVLAKTAQCEDRQIIQTSAKCLEGHDLALVLEDPYGLSRDGFGRLWNLLDFSLTHKTCFQKLLMKKLEKALDRPLFNEVLASTAQPSARALNCLVNSEDLDEISSKIQSHAANITHLTKTPTICQYSATNYLNEIVRSLKDNLTIGSELSQLMITYSNLDSVETTTELQSTSNSEEVGHSNKGLSVAVEKLKALTETVPSQEPMKPTELMIFDMTLSDILALLLENSANNSHQPIFWFADSSFLTGRCLLEYLTTNQIAFTVTVPCVITIEAVVARNILHAYLRGKLNSISNIGALQCNWRDRYHRGLVVVVAQKRLFNALENEDIEGIEEAMKSGADIRGRNSIGWSALHISAKGANLEIVMYVVKEMVNPSILNNAGQTALHIAAANGRLDTVKFLLEVGLVPHTQDIKNRTPLHLAAENGHATVVEYLRNITAPFEDIYGMLALHVGIHHQHVKVVELLSEIPVTAVPNKWRSLHYSVLYENINIVKLLLKIENDINAECGQSWTPLHLATISGNVEVSTLLIDGGANILAKTVDGFSALHLAVLKGKTSLVELLLDRGANPNDVDNLNFSPLHYAAHRGENDIILLLLRRGADINLPGDRMVSSLHLSAREGHLLVCNVLIRYGARITTLDGYGYAPIHYACQKGHLDVVKALVSSGVKVDFPSAKLLTPLHIAAECHPHIVTYLLEQGAKVNFEDHIGRIALHKACYGGNLDSLRLLIGKGSNVSHKTHAGRTPLHIACAGGYYDACLLLLQNDADVNAITCSGTSSLHKAVVRGQIKIVKLLIERGVDVSLVDNNGTSPLQLASESGHTLIVQLLLEAGAGSHEENIFTSFMYAILNHHFEVVKLLLHTNVTYETTAIQPLLLACKLESIEIVRLLINSNVGPIIREGRKAMLYAVKENKPDILSLLLTKKDALNLNQEILDSSLLFSSYLGNSSIVQLLLKHGAYVNYSCNGHVSPLHVAAIAGKSEVVKILLDNGADSRSQDQFQQTPIMCAAASDNVDVLEILLWKDGLNPTSLTGEEAMLLHIVVENGSIETLNHMITIGWNLKAINQLGSKAIHTAARSGKAEMIPLLVHQGLSVNERGSTGKTPLHYATLYKHINVLETLIQLSADVDMQDSSGKSPLHLASQQGSINIIRLLLTSGAIYNLLDNEQKAPIDMTEDQDIINVFTNVGLLFESAERKDLASVEHYIRLGVPLNAKSSGKGSILSMAAESGAFKLIDFLIHNGADPNIKDESHYQPLHRAVKASNSKIVQFLLTNGAIYNDITIDNQTPLSLAKSSQVMKLLKLIDKLFQLVRNNSPEAIDFLSQQDDITRKAMIGARDREDGSVIVLGIRSHYCSLQALNMMAQGQMDKEFLKGLALFEKDDNGAALNTFLNVKYKRLLLLGPEHPDTLEVDKYIGKVLYSAGYYDKARETIDHVYSVQSRIFGEDSAEALSTKSFQALVLYKLGDEDGSLRLYREVLEKQERLLGPHHLDTLVTQFHMAITLNNLGHHDEAMRINDLVYRTQQQYLGDNHASTVKALGNSAAILESMGKLDEALVIYNRVLNIRKQILNPTHTDLIKTKEQISHLYVLQERFHDAIAVHTEIMEDIKETYGPQHPGIGMSLLSIGNIHYQSGRLVAAIGPYLESLKFARAVFESDHEIIESLIDKLESINAKLNLECTDVNELYDQIAEKLRTAVCEGDVATIVGLLDEGAVIDFRDAYGRTMLHQATICNEGKVVEVLLDRGANVMELTGKGNTVLHLAASVTNLDLLEILLPSIPQTELVSFINRKTAKTGNTCLHFAALNGSFDMIICLLTYGAIYKVKNFDGKTPSEITPHKHVSTFFNLLDTIFEGVEAGNMRIVRTLRTLELKEMLAVTRARNEKGRTILQVAIKKKRKPLCTMLINLLKDIQNQEDEEKQ